MPSAARGDSENLGGAFGSNTSVRVVRGQDEDSPSSLRDSVIPSIKDSPRHAVPEVGKTFEKRSHVSALVG